jgi:lipopolysaccharide export system permease protein
VNLSARGHFSPLLAVGGAFTAFAVLTLWLFFSSLNRPGDTPLARAMLAAQKLLDRRPKVGGRPAKPRRSMRHALPVYLAKQLGGKVLAAGLSVIALLQLVDLLDRMPEILAHGVGVAGIFHYAFLRLPGLAEQAAGIAVLVGGIFTFMQLAKNSEIIAMRATGLSILQIFKMSVPVVLIVALADVAVLDQAAPRAQDALASWWAATTPAASRTVGQPKWFRINNDVVRADSASFDGQRLNVVKLYRRSAGKDLQERVEAAYATPSPDGWTLHDARVTAIAGEKAYTTPARQVIWKTPLKSEDAARLFNGGFLITAATAVRSLGGAIAVNQSPSFYATRLHRTFAEPLAPLIMLLLALPLALSSTRSGNNVKLVLYAVGGGLCYLVADGLLTAMGQAGFLPPIMAAWLAPLLFGAGATTALLYSER